MKVIFLDKDGVLNSKTYLEHQKSIRNSFSKILRTEEDKIRYEMFSLDPKCLKYLKNIVKETNASLVLTSTARFHMPLLKFLEYYGLPIYDVTPCIGNQRNLEIDAFLKSHPEIVDYIILDDEYYTFTEEQRKHLIQTEHFLTGHGLSEQNCIDAIQRLNVIQRKRRK